MLFLSDVQKMFCREIIVILKKVRPWSIVSARKFYFRAKVAPEDLFWEGFLRKGANKHWWLVKKMVEKCCCHYGTKPEFLVAKNEMLVVLVTRSVTMLFCGLDNSLSKLFKFIVLNIFFRGRSLLGYHKRDIALQSSYCMIHFDDIPVLQTLHSDCKYYHCFWFAWMLSLLKFGINFGLFSFVEILLKSLN